MPTAQEKRFIALCQSLVAGGFMGDDPAPLSGIDFAPPDDVAPFWREGADHTAAQALIDGWDWTPRTDIQELREEAAALFSAMEREGQALRGLALVTMDEVNILRSWVAQFKAAVNLASSLADLKTRVAALPNVPQRTASDIKPAIVTKINSADAD